MDAAVPSRNPTPAEAIQAAPMEAIEALCIGVVDPFSIISAMFLAANFPIIPDGIPVRGGVGVMSVPLGLVLGREI